MKLRVLLAACLTIVACDGAQRPPDQMLWHWFANGDVRFVQPQRAGIAFHALSIALKGRDEAIAYPRRSPLPLSAGVYRMAVIRIEDRGAAFTSAQRLQAAKMIGKIAIVMRVPAVQIDFDAPKSARAFYKELLKDVRARLGRDIFLSITALTSWCESNSWMASLDVDELVPMAFDMGRGGPPITAMLKQGGQFGFAGCRTSIGMSLTEGAVAVEPGQRIYLFADHQRWSAALVNSALRRYGR